MSAISITDPKCQRCSRRNDCDNKQMMLCAAVDPEQSSTKITVDVMMPISIEAARDTSIQAEIAEKMKKDFYRHQGLGLNAK